MQRTCCRNTHGRTRGRARRIAACWGRGALRRARLFSPFLALLTCLLLATGAQAQDKNHGGLLYNNGSGCVSCHGSTSPFGGMAMGIQGAANDPGLINSAANAPGVGGSYPTMTGDAWIIANIASNPSNQADVAYYIADYVAPVVENAPTVSTYYKTAVQVNLSPYISSPTTFAGGNSNNNLSVTGALHGTISNVTTTGFTYTPSAAASSVSDTLTFTASNNAGGSSNSGTVTISIGAAPTANPQTFNVSYEGSLMATLSNYSATAPATLIAPTVGTVGSNGGRITAVSGFTLTYQAPTDKLGSDSFNYTVHDNVGNAAMSTVTFNVVAPGAPTVVSPFNLNAAFNSGSGGGTTALNIAGAFSGPVDSYSAPVYMGGNGATVASGGGATVNYTPAVGFHGTDTFTITATNASGTSAVATVTVTVLSPAAPTVATTPFATTATFNNGPAPGTSTLLDLSSVFSGYVQSLTLGATAHGGTVATSGATGVTYTPPVGFHGTDSFTATAHNFVGASGPATINVTVNYPAAPVAHALTVNNVPYNTLQAIDLSGSITGVVNLTNPVTITTAPTSGTATVSGETVSYTGNATFYGGTDTFSYVANGPGATSAAATVTINVSNPPPPTASAFAINAVFNTTTQVNLRNEVQGVTQSAALATAPSHGTASVSGYTLTYTPTPNYLGTDTLTFVAVGPHANSAPAQLTITVKPEPTEAPPLKVNAALNSPTTLDLASFVTGSLITGVSIPTKPGHGTVTVNGTQITYTPVHDYFGLDHFSYIAYGAGGNAMGVITMQIVGRPDPTQNADVAGLIDAQAAAARRFTRAQIDNFRDRMETLHRGEHEPVEDIEEPPPVPGTPPPSSQNGTTRLSRGLVAAADAPSAVQAPNTPTLGQALAAAAASSRGGAANPAVDPFADPPAAAPQTPAAASPPRAGATWPAAGAIAPATNQPALPSGFAQGAANLQASSLSSLDVGSVAAPALAASGDPGSGVGFWAAGSVNFGDRPQPGTVPGGQRFTSDGVSVGVDKRFSDAFSAGIGLGYAWDDTAVGSDGTTSNAHGSVLAAYASYSPLTNFFLDGVIGVGNLDFSTTRFVAPIDAFATGHRTGDQVFASLTADYEYRRNELQVDPYARLDLADDRLHQYSESGAGNYALNYAAQSVPTDGVALGLKVSLDHATTFGSVTPHARIEYEHEFESSGSTSVAYADLVGGPSYGVPLNALNRNALTFGVGVDFAFEHGVALGVDYETLRAAGSEGSQLIRLRITKQLDDDLIPTSILPGAAFNRPLGLRLDAGYTYDSNVTRNDGSDKLTDSSYRLDVSRPFVLPITDYIRAIVTPSIGGEKFRNYTDLDNTEYGGSAELQFRPGREFDTPTFALFLRGSDDQWDSWIRTGYHYSTGLSIRQPVTDRIALFGALAYDDRHANGLAFDDADGAARLNVDYALSTHGTVYVTGEYRRGEIATTGAGDLGSFDIATAVTTDTAFGPAVQRFAYRFRANTYLATVGYNLALGETDSLDVSWRWAQSTPLTQPSFSGASFIRYYDNQFAIVYLMRF